MQGAPTAQAAPMNQSCPWMVDPATTQIMVTDTNEGVAISFTTDANVQDLRSRVDMMADRHNVMVGQRGEMQGQPAMPQGAPDRGMHHAMVPSRAEVVEIDNGARMMITPDDPAQVARLQQDARAQMAMMQQGQCPMMATSPEMMQQGQAPPSG